MGSFFRLGASARSQRSSRQHVALVHLEGMGVQWQDTCKDIIGRWDVHGDSLVDLVTFGAIVCTGAEGDGQIKEADTRAEGIFRGSLE